ncbi:16S rRNA (guanine(966)-N(2))-methyltransferase RsmD [Vaginella massiliensis]|uniref:16S rRNA (guanine(966)-N(2))-methyltransferase RsmD n=1 Tax=Vaginella massiliensis TaxID=1816680 RepID=UPI00083829CE|nr:16S rRNA (guanine(966)-N(2))-methyltransferase RsmD [Vaginella massiliensis]
MRIISGEFRGKRIQAPNNLPVRPTTDFAKEALFNILNNEWYFDEIEVLDLFAGIGSISFEFASRGAKHITVVDLHLPCIKFVDQTAKKLKADDRIQTIKADALKFTSKPALRAYDIVFADPPYDMSLEEYKTVVDQVLDNGWLAEEGTLVLEHPTQYKFEDHLRFTLHKKYGNVNFSFFS